jgi:hypothetical protein
LGESNFQPGGFAFETDCMTFALGAAAKFNGKMLEEPIMKRYRQLTGREREIECVMGS